MTDLVLSILACVLLLLAILAGENMVEVYDNWRWQRHIRPFHKASVRFLANWEPMEVRKKETPHD